MSKYLLALVWPAGLAIIAGVAFVAGRRAHEEPQQASGRSAREPGRRRGRRASARSWIGEAAAGSTLFAVAAVAGALAAFCIMALLGLLVVNHGLAIDKPVFSWIQGDRINQAGTALWSHGHQVHVVAAAMKRLTKIGDTWTTWGAAAAAAVCLAVTWRERRWLPPVALAAAIVIDHFTTLALRHVFHRLGPPTSPLGTHPSGGCDRCILFYGLIAYLLWREFSGKRTTAIWAAAAVAALGFNEAYSRVYLSLHWTTDALSGLLYGGLLLAGFVVAIRAVCGRQAARRAAEPFPPVPVGIAPTEGASP